jgi:hypothetical protein
MLFVFLSRSFPHYHTEGSSRRTLDITLEVDISSLNNIRPASCDNVAGFYSEGLSLNLGQATGCPDFSLLHSVQTGFGTHPPGVKRPGSEADYSPPSSAVTPPDAFMACCLIN